jgi:hypothetical protein
MTRSRQATRLACAIFAAPLAISVLTLSGCKSYEPAKVEGGATRTILLLAGQDECVAIPQETYAHDGDRLVFFSPNATAMVNGLNRYPEGTDPDRPTGTRLTDDASLDLEKGVMGSIRINDGAEGSYQIGVECGGFRDDPPKIVIW